MYLYIYIWYIYICIIQGSKQFSSRVRQTSFWPAHKSHGVDPMVSVVAFTGQHFVPQTIGKDSGAVETVCHATWAYDLLRMHESAKTTSIYDLLCGMWRRRRGNLGWRPKSWWEWPSKVGESGLQDWWRPKLSLTKPRQGLRQGNSMPYGNNGVLTIEPVKLFELLRSSARWACDRSVGGPPVGRSVSLQPVSPRNPVHKAKTEQ
jgi:hypothetical protein